jgi:hypothetical protein
LGSPGIMPRKDEPPRRRGTPWKYSPPSKASEYHLIDLFAGVSQGLKR